MFSGSTAEPDRAAARTFQAGLAVFTIGSLLVQPGPGPGLASSPSGWSRRWAGSMLNPVAMSIIVNTFTDQAETCPGDPASGAACSASGVALGPVVGGGALVDSVGWRGIFWVNIPVGIAAIVLTAPLRARVPGRQAPPARPGGPGPGHRLAGLVDLRDHRGPRLGLGHRRRSCSSSVSPSWR